MFCVRLNEIYDYNMWVGRTITDYFIYNISIIKQPLHVLLHKQIYSFELQLFTLDVQ